MTPSWFTGISSNDDPDVWIPMMMTNAVLTGETVRNANTSSLYVFGRLKPGVTAAQASEDIARVYRDLPRTAVHVDDQRGEVVPMSKGVQTLRPRFERPLLILFGVVGLLLLLACANLAALLTARAAARYREIAVRLSLGASGARLARQFLTETLLLAGLGGIAGLLVAWWGTSLLIAIVTSSTRRLPLHFALDWRIVAFTSVVSILTAILFGLLATFPSQNPVGKRLSFDSTFQEQNAVDIVGVVRDVRYNNLRRASPSTIYLPLQQAPTPRVDLQVRTSVHPTVVAAQIQEAIRRYAPGGRVVHTVTLDRLVEDSIAGSPARAAGGLLRRARALAVRCWTLWHHGVQRESTHERNRGAPGPGCVHRACAVDGAPRGAGARRDRRGGGIPVALMAAGVVRGLLFGLTPTDPLSLTAATVALMLIALLAGSLPARRACRVEPIQALRCE